LARMIMGKYPTLMVDNPDQKTTDFAEILQNLQMRDDLDAYVLTRDQLMQLLQRVKVQP
jgi:hypothetical protein